MKNKPNKYGARLDCVCDAQNGFLCNFLVYAGAERQTDPVTGVVKKKPPKRVNELVKELLASHVNKNHRVFMDRRFGSPYLFRELLELGFYPNGTCNKNRKGLPEDFKRKKLKRGEVLSFQADGVMALKWKDKRDVYMLSTADKDELIETNTL
jgi:hypothetical protein